MMNRMLLAIVLAPSLTFAQDTAEVRRLFEAGRYQQVIDASENAAPPEVIYTAAQSHQRLSHIDAARSAYDELAARPESDPWHFIGLSGRHLLDDATDPALEAAQRAVATAGMLPDAHYQLGLVLARREDWGAAAAAFDRAVELNPMFAYAHYNGGLMHYRAGRPDRMAIHFERFLKLAPEAPERPEVLSIMRTIRGR